MRSAKLAAIGCVVAAGLILSNVFLLRYFTNSVKNTLASEKKLKVRIVSKYTLPFDQVPVNDEYGILDDQKIPTPVVETTRSPVVYDLEELVKSKEKTTEELPARLPKALNGLLFHRPSTTRSTSVATQKVTTTPIKEHPDLDKLINDIRSPANFSCHLKVKFGRDENKEFGHETWRLCFDEPYKIEPPCLVYSFGIAYDFTFDDDMASFGCQVFSFDPSMEMADHKRESGVMFFNIGIAQRDSFTYQPEINAFNNKTKWVVKSLRSIRKSLKHQQKTIDVLKMDVEGMEWRSLKQAIDDGVLDLVKYLLIEWHVCPSDLTNSPKIEGARQVYRQLFQLGFSKYFNDPWITDEASKCRMVLNYFVRPASFAKRKAS